MASRIYRSEKNLETPSDCMLEMVDLIDEITNHAVPHFYQPFYIVIKTSQYANNERFN